MTIFLILAPYGAFAFLMMVTSAAASLFAAAAICFATVVLDIVRGRSVKSSAPDRWSRSLRSAAMSG
jgi:hypothetical protein